jgi:hypothetical protein
MEDRNIILAGCSYTINTWFGGTPHDPSDPFTFGGFLAHNHSDLKIKHIAVSGNSNDASIRQIYDYVKSNTIKNSTIIFQVTHLHRIGGYFNFLDEWINLQPMILNSHSSKKIEEESFTLDNINTVELSKNQIYGTQVLDQSQPSYSPINADDEFWKNGDSYIKERIMDYYKIWLEYKYDDFLEFKELLFKIDLLKGYLSQNNNKLLLMYWPDIYPSYLPYLKEYEFFNIDGEYSMIRWSKKNNVIGDDTHLTLNGHKMLYLKLYDYLNLNKL